MKKYAYIFIFYLLMIAPASVSAASGGIDPVYPYAWSEDFGWINFDAPQGGVEVADTDLTGYAWSQNTGWINLHPSSTIYVHNDGQGNLSGYAWGAGIGYIDFDGVTIDAQGFFHGYATSTSGDVISFNCLNTNDCGSSNFAVKTFWQATASAGGGGSGGAIAASGGGSANGASGASGMPIGVAVAQATPAVLASCSYTTPETADINGDGRVDVFDFNILMVDWGTVGHDRADINHDCAVDILDFNQMMVRWTG